MPYLLIKGGIQGDVKNRNSKSEIFGEAKIEDAIFTDKK